MLKGLIDIKVYGAFLMPKTKGVPYKKFKANFDGWNKQEQAKTSLELSKII